MLENQQKALLNKDARYYLKNLGEPVALSSRNSRAD